MTIAHLEPDALKALLAEASSVPVLLDLWAPWCAPCRAQEPALQKLADSAGEHLRVVKLNVEKFPEMSKALQVRGIPCLILFKNGRESQRKSGTQTLVQLHQWMSEHEIDRSDAAAGTVANSTSDHANFLGGAFYGDPELRDFLVNRLVATGVEQRIVVSRFPYWTADTGTVSAALVRSQNRDVFERVTGLPLSFGTCLEFVGLTRPNDVQAVFDLVPAGATIGYLPARLMLKWLGDVELGWPEFLGDRANELRLRWVAHCSDVLEGREVSPQTWTTLRALAEPFEAADSDPTLVVQHHFAKMLLAISPVPDSSEAVWGSAFLLLGTYLVLSLNRYRDGWRTPDFAVESTTSNWYKARCPTPQDATRERLEELRPQFHREHAEILAAHKPLEDLAYKNHDHRMAEAHARLRSHLDLALRMAVKAP